MKRKILILISIIIIIIILIGILNNSPYTKEARKTMRNEKLNIKEYSETLEKALEKNTYINDKINEYINITYINTPNFIDTINKLLVLNYTANNINNIFINLNASTISNLTTIENIGEIINYIDKDYFDESKLERYFNYKNSTNTNTYDSIIYVNINLDKEFYTNIKIIKNPDELLVLVNKYNQLPSTYESKSLVKINPIYTYGKEKYIRKEALASFNKLIDDAKENNIFIYTQSSYRSFETQENIYNYYLQTDSKEIVDTYSARPGHSEHQTGLSVDLYNADYALIRKNTKEHLWYKDILHEYGFIIRYPENKTKITGFKFEPWHIRYVGINIATYIYNHNITFDEYIAAQKKD